MNSMLAGSLAGLAATAPMTVMMKFLHRALPHDEQYALPPKQITRDVEVNRELKGQQETGQNNDRWGVPTYLAHFGFGVAAGAAYATTTHWLPVHPILKGIGFGLCVWTSSYLGWLPALRVLPSATQEPSGRNAVMIASHIAWGAVTGWVTSHLSKGQLSRR